MKIDKITLCNLTSIEGEQTIDFTQEPLRSAGLFAITGDMGSGKSTLLDAVCLALYNKAPRFENIERLSADDLRLSAEKSQQVQASNTATILRRGQKQGYATVEFSTTAGERYVARWSIRVTRGGNYTPAERTLERIAPSHERIDKANLQERIEMAVGLSYDQFTRTVILAQGSFANFLKARSADKAALLEKLTGTEVYSVVGQRIFTLTVEAKTQVDNLHHEMQGMLHNRLDPQDLAQLQERSQLLTASKLNAEQETHRTEQQMLWIDRFSEAAREVAKREAQYAAATKECMEARGDELRLERYDSLLPMQPLYQAIEMRRADVDRIKTDEALNTSELERSRSELEAKRTQLDVMRERTADAEKQLEVQRPAIDRGLSLTGEINMASDQQHQLEEQLHQASQVEYKRQEALKAAQEKLKSVSAQLKEKQLHKQSLEVHRHMFDKFDLIKDKLSALSNETRRNTEAHNKQAALQKRIAELRAQGEKAEQERHNQQARLNTLKSELLIHRQTNQGIDSARLQRAAAENRARLVALERAAQLWQHISQGYASIADKTAAQKREQTELAQKQATMRKLDIEVLAADEAFARFSTAYTLSQSENIVNLRKQLKEGTACPVCGATHHPYHTETERELGELLGNMDKEYAALQSDLKTKRDRLTTLREEVAADAARLEADARSLQELKARQKADVDEWADYAFLDKSFADCTATVNRDARRTMIQLLIENTTRTAEEAQHELETYNFHQQHINRLNEEITQLDVKMDDNHTFLDKVRTEAHSATATAEELQQTINESDRACSELYTDLDGMITLSGWFSLWRDNADGLRLRLTDLYTDWTSTCQAIDNGERSEALLCEEIRGAETHLTEATHHVEQCRQSRDSVRESVVRKREELRSLLGSTTPQKLTEQLQTAIAQARTEEQRTRQEFETLQGRLRQLQGQRDNLQKSRLENQHQQQEKQQELDLMILRFNGTHSPVQFTELRAIFTAKTDWASMRHRISALADARLLADDALKKARLQLQALQAAPERPSFSAAKAVGSAEAQPTAAQPIAEVLPNTVEENHSADLPLENLTARYLDLRNNLEGLHTALATRLEQISEELTQIQSRLLAHKTSVERATALEQRINTATDNAREWERLNALFGSADGKKFRTIAQSCTFSYLVAQANLHLRQLSPRYELHNVPGTLTLEVVDRDMFDEHRYVNSLSGGETFVVSLALALGLASLSSKNLNIGSLFIDEGFGNLDRDSLDLVMLALSNLENVQGRKVGIISHTEQIRSQLSPQIRLVRQPGSGSSRIQVV